MDPLFPPSYERGHFAIIGATGTGKSHYAKYIVSELKARHPEMLIHVYVAPMSYSNWSLPESSGCQVVPVENIHTEWYPGDDTKPLYELLRAAPRSLLIFDDFKLQLNFHHSEGFKGLTRVCRQLNTQMIVIGHSPNDLPPAARTNTAHAIITYTSNLEAIKALATTYLGGDIPRLRDVLAGMKRHDVIHIGTTDNTVELHRATSNIATSAVGIGGSSEAVDIRVGGASASGATINATNRGNVAVQGTYHDNSVSNQYLRLEENIAVQQRTQALALQDIRNRAALADQIEFEHYRSQARLDSVKEKDEAYRLLHKPYLSSEERLRLASILSRQLHDASITPHNYRRVGADTAFMAIAFPEVAYTPPSDLVEYGSLVPQILGGDVKGIAGELALTAVSSGSIVGGLASSIGSGLSSAKSLLFGSAPTPRIEERSRGARYSEIRRLVLKLASSKLTEDEKTLLHSLMARTRVGTPVTKENLAKLSLEFLKDIYPEDYSRLCSRHT